MTRYISEANLKFLGILVTVMLGLGGIVFNFYKVQQSMALEARRPFLEKQLEICFEATNAAAAIASGLNAPTGDERPRDTFMRLYLGNLAIVENDEVACAMTRFVRTSGSLSSVLAEKRDAGIVESAVSNRDHCRTKPLTMQEASLELALACRTLILDSWGVELSANPRAQ